MKGETNLKKLLQNMSPELQEGDYVFCTVPEVKAEFFSIIIGLFREKEGWTIVTRKEAAEQYKLACSSEMAWITLNIHSALEAVGLTAAISNALAKHHISCNVVAAYYHDHIFIPKADAQRALAILNDVSLR